MVCVKGFVAVHRRKDVARHRISPSQDGHRNQPRTAEAHIWAGVCAELANRGAKDVPIIYCGGLSGFPEAIEATLLDEDPSPAEVITKHVEHWQRNYFRGGHCEYHLTGSVCRSACWNS